MKDTEDDYKRCINMMYVRHLYGTRIVDMVRADIERAHESRVFFAQKWSSFHCVY